MLQLENHPFVRRVKYSSQPGRVKLPHGVQLKGSRKLKLQHLSTACYATAKITDQMLLYKRSLYLPWGILVKNGTIKLSIQGMQPMDFPCGYQLDRAISPVPGGTIYVT